MRKSVFLFLFVVSCAVFLSSCSRQLETDLSESDAQQIVVLLRENGISASVEPAPAGGQKKDAASWQVTVEGQSDTVIRAWKILRENGLPREKIKGLDDVYANAGMIPTAAEEKARLMSGLNGELTRTLDSLPGVVDARVQIVLPDNSILIDKDRQTPTTASVLIQYRGDQPPLKESEVKSLMSKGVEGLSPENVAVVFKQVEIKAIPVQVFGPLSIERWLQILIVVFAGTVSIGLIAMLAMSKRRQLKIRKLEQQLQAANAAQSSSAVAKA